MKKLILAIFLLLALSAGFSDVISDFVKNNLNFVIAAFSFVLVFGLSMGAASMWVEKPAQVAIIALGISVLISVLILLNPNLSTIIASVIQFSPIFLIAFIMIALVLIIVLAPKDKKGMKLVAGAVLLGAIVGVFYLSGESGTSIGSGSSSGVGLMDIGLITLIALGIGAVAFIIVKNKGSSGEESSGNTSSKSSGSPDKSVKSSGNPKKASIKGKVLDFRTSSKGKPMKDLKVTTEPAISGPEILTNRSGEFEIKIPETEFDSSTNTLKIEKVKVNFNGIEYDHLMLNGKPDSDRDNKGNGFIMNKGTTRSDIVIPINKNSLPISTGNARITVQAIQYSEDGTAGTAIPGLQVTLTKGGNTLPAVTDASGSCEINIPSADIVKYNGGEISTDYSGKKYSHRFIFGRFDKKRELVQLKPNINIDAIIPIIPEPFLKHFIIDGFTAFYNSVLDNVNLSNFSDFSKLDSYYFAQLIQLLNGGAKIDQKFPNNTNPAFNSANKLDWVTLATNFNNVFNDSSCNRDDLVKYYWNIIMETLIALPGTNIFAISTRAGFNKLIEDLKNSSGTLKSKYDKVKV